MPVGKYAVSNIKDGKRIHPTPTRLYRVPKDVNSPKATPVSDITTNYHGAQLEYKDQVEKTKKVYNDPKPHRDRDGQHYRDSASRQASNYRAADVVDTSSGVSSNPEPAC